MRIHWLAAVPPARIVSTPARAGPLRASPASGPVLRRPRRLRARPENPPAGRLRACSR